MKVLKIFFIEKCFVVSNNQLTKTAQSFLRVQVCVDLGYNIILNTCTIFNLFTLTTLTRGEVKIVWPTLITSATNHIRLAGTLSTISVTLIRIFGSNCATVARYIKK